MADLYDYLDWRGDLKFSAVPLNIVDTLAFSVLSYIRLEEYIPAAPDADPVRLVNVAARYLKSPVQKSRYAKFLRRMASSPRFSTIRLLAAQNELDRKSGIQFAAYTALLPGQTMLVVFEGTDDSLVGWEEDFRMSYECPVPGQLRAVSYLRDVASAHPLHHIVVCGHSKGGNLAMYASVKVEPAIRARIKEVHNFDGPGFCDNTVYTAEYAEMRDRIRSFLPESSIVAALLEHGDDQKIVKSSAKGLLQHEPITWEIKGADFVYTDKRTAFGKETESILNHFNQSLSPERKKLFGKALFSVLASTEQNTFSGIATNKVQSARNALRGFTSMDPEVRELLVTTLLGMAESRRAVKKTAKK